MDEAAIRADERAQILALVIEQTTEFVGGPTEEYVKGYAEGFAEALAEYRRAIGARG